MTTRRNDQLNRTSVGWLGLEINHLNEVDSDPEDRMPIWVLAVSGERELRNSDLEALLRWEGDGGQTT